MTTSEQDDPMLEEVRGWYIDGRRVHNPFASDAELVARFDEWLADHDAEVRAGVLSLLGSDTAVEGAVCGWLGLPEVDASVDFMKPRMRNAIAAAVAAITNQESSDSGSDT